MICLDAGTTYSKIISDKKISAIEKYFIKEKNDKFYYILNSKQLESLNLKFDKACGHLGGNIKENEIIALAFGAKETCDKNATILDLGSRDAKWISFNNGNFKDMDWNTSCASSTGATVEMLLKFYEIDMNKLTFVDEKYPVTCGVFGMEKIMDDISNGEKAEIAISKFIHGLAFNAWNFCKNPEKIYLSGGFGENKCFINSLKKYCDVELLGRFVIVEGLL